MELLYTLMRVLFPDFCCKCGKYGVILCTPCTLSLPDARKPSHPACFAGLSYQNPITRSIILSLKTRPNPAIARALCLRVYESVFEDLSELAQTHNFTNPIIIPIPGSPEKLSTYGFNHADILAREFATYLQEFNPVIATTILRKKSTHTKQAKTRDRKARFHNMQQAFILNESKKSLLQNACVIIVDDVITTGATCLSARQLLLDAGARQVFCVAIAH